MPYLAIYTNEHSDSILKITLPISVVQKTLHLDLGVSSGQSKRMKSLEMISRSNNSRNRLCISIMVLLHLMLDINFYEGNKFVHGAKNESN